MDLFLLLQRQFLFLHNLCTLVACLEKSCATLVQNFTYSLWRLILTFLDRDSFTDLRELDLILNLANTYQLLLIWFIPHGHAWSYLHIGGCLGPSTSISSRYGFFIIHQWLLLLHRLARSIILHFSQIKLEAQLRCFLSCDCLDEFKLRSYLFFRSTLTTTLWKRQFLFGRIIGSIVVSLANDRWLLLRLLLVTTCIQNSTTVVLVVLTVSVATASLFDGHDHINLLSIDLVTVSTTFLPIQRHSSDRLHLILTWIITALTHFAVLLIRVSYRLGYARAISLFSLRWCFRF